MVLAVSLSTSACVLQKAKNSGPVIEKQQATGTILEGENVTKASIHPDRQQLFFEKLLTMTGSKEAWALFSYNGWLNGAGETIRIYSQKDGRLIVEKTDPFNEKTITNSITVEQTKANQYVTIFDKVRDLEDQKDSSADGYQYQYVNAIRSESGDVLVVKRIYMSNPTKEKNPRHFDLLGGFEFEQLTTAGK